MTKSKLLASTALVSAVAVAGAAGASAASLKLGGFAEFWVGYGDNEKAEGTQNNFDTKIDSEIHFRAEETLDNGIKVGALFEFEAGQANDGSNGPSPGSASNADGWDETFGWVKTKWGQVNVGNNDLATGYVGGVETVGPIGIVKSDAGDWVRGSYELNNTDVDLGLGDSQNITYFTPRVSGAQLIVSYTPDESQNIEGDFDETKTSGKHDGWSIAGKWSGKFDKVGIAIGAGYTVVENDGDTNPSVDDAEGYNAKIALTMGAFKATAAYARENVGNGSDEDEHWGASLLYSIDKMQRVSIAYGRGEESKTSSGNDHESWVATAGYERKLGKGIAFAGSIFLSDVDQDGTSNDRDGWGVVGGFTLKF